MAQDHEQINVVVSKRVLWIGGEAYPLSNIARAQALRLTNAGRGKTVWRNALGIVGWLVLWGIASAIIGSGVGVAVAALVAVALIIRNVLRIIRELTKPDLFALVLETSGAPHRALVTDDGDLVVRLVRQIMDAIDNPEAFFEMHVNQYHYGDNLTQVGDHNIGKAMR
ncbi:MAG TPA: DUF6232 family protein [Actinocrinis sp.]|jgi:hypothetical protein